jgi:hypothetical protein
MPRPSRPKLLKVVFSKVGDGRGRSGKLKKVRVPKSHAGSADVGALFSSGLLEI